MKSVTQSFDNIVNVAWEGAKAAEEGKLSKKRCYQLIDEIQKEITNIKRVLYQSSDIDAEEIK